MLVSSSGSAALAVLGATVPIGLDQLPRALQPSYSPLAKTKFSMVLPEVIESLKQWKTESVILVGIEVRACHLCLSRWICH